jgi:hypothetical protein
VAAILVQPMLPTQRHSAGLPFVKATGLQILQNCFLLKVSFFLLPFLAPKSLKDKTSN